LRWSAVAVKWNVEVDGGSGSFETDGHAGGVCREGRAKVVGALIGATEWFGVGNVASTVIVDGGDDELPGPELGVGVAGVEEVQGGAVREADERL
jgi:hypothetical protein